VSHSSPREAGFDGLIELAKEAAAVPCDPVIDRIGRARLAQRVTCSRFNRRDWARWFGPVPKLAWAALIAVVIGGFAWGLASRPICFVVRGADRAESYVRAADDRAVDVDFSDGTRIHADAGARLRIEARSSRGARVLLESGRATAQVAHRAGAQWCFVAGPFEVEVKGTRFVLAWDPMNEQLDLKLEAGLVEVLGPLGPRPVAVHAGQQLVANVARRSLMLSELGKSELGKSEFGTPSYSPPALPSNQLVAESAPLASVGLALEPTGDAAFVTEVDGSRASELAPKSPAAPAQVSWSKLLAKGQFAAIVRLAENPERPNCNETCSATDLRALAEAARYVGRADLAESTLLALRRRYPEHAESRKAAFLLGRLYEARADRGRAESWYGTYLAESPSSELAADALAGQMRVARRARGTKAAEPLAREYLRRYPDGVHAAAAQQILGEH